MSWEITIKGKKPCFEGHMSLRYNIETAALLYDHIMPILRTKDRLRLMLSSDLFAEMIPRFPSKIPKVIEQIRSHPDFDGSIMESVEIHRGVAKRYLPIVSPLWYALYYGLPLSKYMFDYGVYQDHDLGVMIKNINKHLGLRGSLLSISLGLERQS